MSVIGVGIDVVPVERVQRLIERHGERALQRLFTPSEIARAGDLVHQALHLDRKSTRLNSSHIQKSRMPSSA